VVICGCGFCACCCQPAVAGGVIYADLRGELSTHLALQALFTQSSPVGELLLQAFPFPSTLGKVTLHPLSQACVFIYSSRAKWVSPLSYGVFLPPPLSQAFLLLIAGPTSLLPPSLARSGLFIYSSVRDSPPAPLALRVPHPLSYCLYCSYCLLLSFSFFFPGWGSVCPGGYADLAQGCLWEYRGTVKLTLWSASSQAVWAWASGSPGALLISPFNVKWRCSVQAGGVEGSKFCLFSVALPARYVSSISPRFHFRRHAFCFLPLAAIFWSFQLQNQESAFTFNIQIISSEK
jgi:hypothetical protein